MFRLTLDCHGATCLWLPLLNFVLAATRTDWTLGIDPLLSIVLGAIPSYFFGVWFTENVFAQKPLVAQAVCPECQFQFNLFFGDLFGVQTDGIVPPKGPPGNKILCKCPSPSCKIDLEADRDTMIIITAKSKVPA